MASTTALSDFITRARQALATIDDGARQIGGLYWQASRLCEFENGAEGWTPKRNPDGSFVMLVTDEELSAMGHHMTAQQLGMALFGAVELMSGIPTDLADLIGTVRA